MPQVGEAFSPLSIFSSVWIPPAIFHNESLTATAKLCYGRIAHHCGKRNYCWPSQEVLARDLGSSARTIRDCISQLEEHGYIKVKQLGLTKTNRYYLLWFKELEDCLRSPDRQETSGQGENESVNVQRISTPDRRRTSSHIETNAVEQIQSASESPIVPFSDLNLEDPIEVFLTNVWRRERNLKLNLRPKGQAQTVDRCRQLERIHGSAKVRHGALTYLRSDDDWLRQEKWPIRTFLSQIENWIDKAQGMASAAAQPASLPGSEGGGAITHAESEPIESSPVSASGNVNSALGLPMPCEEWNRIVMAGEPVVGWTKRDKPLESTLYDGDFLISLPDVLKICQRLHETQGDEVSWLNFRWLLRKDKMGVDNWYKVFTEGAGWGKKKRSSGGRAPEFEAYLNKLAEEDRADHA